MADDDTNQDMTKVWRAVHGPRPIGALVPVVARTAFAKGSYGTVRLMEAWPGIVGPALAEVTIPRRLSRGSLTIGCSGPVAMELQHLSTEVLARVNQYLGGQTVTALRFVQTQILGKRPKPPPRPNRAADNAAALGAAQAVAHLPAGPLRDALATLGRAVLTESASRLGKQTRTTS